MAGPLGAFTVTLGGYPLVCIPDPDHPDAEQAPGYDGRFASQDPSLLLTKRDSVVKLTRFSKGFGIVRRRDADDDGGYAWLENGLGWVGDGLQPAGKRNEQVVNSICNTGYVFDSVNYFSDIWMATSVRGVLRFGSANPASVPTAEPAVTTYNGGLGMRSGYHPRAICVFSDNTGAPAVYVSTYNSGTAGTRLYEYIQSTGWVAGSESPDLGFRLDHLKSVYWTDATGTGAERLVGVTADSQIRHCIQGSDPLLAASWVAPIDVGNVAYPIKALAATPQHLWVIKTNGIHDVNALRSANLTPYWEATASINAMAPRMAVAILNEYLYVAKGYGLDRYPISQTGTEQRRPDECHPAFKTQGGHPIRGYVTALAVHNGTLLAAIYNPDNLTSYVMRGFPKQTFAEGHENPLVWHGAELVMAPSGVGYQITHLRPDTPTGSLGPPQPSAPTYLWAPVVAAASPINIGMEYQQLPDMGGPVSLVLSGRSFAGETTSRFYLTAQDWDDDNATKVVRRTDIRGQLVTGSLTLELKSRADGPPTTVTTQATWQSEGTATSDAAKILPATPTQGKTIAYQVVATSSGAAGGPLFLSLSPRAKIIRETYKVIQLNVVLERGRELQNGAPDVRSPSSVFDQVVALQDQGPQVFTDEEGVGRLVLVEQGTPFGKVQIGPNEWRHILRLELSVVATL